MTQEDHIELDNAASYLADLFAQAAERQRAQVAFDADPEATAGVPPMGVEALADLVSKGFDQYVALYAMLDAMPLLPVAPAPVAEEPEGLSGELQLKYRQLAAIRPAKL